MRDGSHFPGCESLEEDLTYLVMFFLIDDSLFGDVLLPGSRDRIDGFTKIECIGFVSVLAL
jgi:hypothetical protein